MASSMAVASDDLPREIRNLLEKKWEKIENQQLKSGRKEKDVQNLLHEVVFRDISNAENGPCLLYGQHNCVIGDGVIGDA